MDDDDDSVHDLMMGPPQAGGEGDLMRVRFPGSPSFQMDADSGAEENVRVVSSGSSSYGNLHGAIPNVSAQYSNESDEVGRQNAGAAASGSSPAGEEEVDRLDPYEALRLQRAQNLLAAHAHHNVTGNNGPASTNGDQNGDQNNDHDNLQIAVDEEGVPLQPPYPGFVSGHLRFVGNVVHPKNITPGDTWTKLTDSHLDGMTPVRAMCINIPAALIQRDALKFDQWTMPAGDGSSRAIATSALTAGLFAGTYMGIPSGNHAERQRAEAQRRAAAPDENASRGGRGGSGRKEGAAEIQEVDSYTYIPRIDQQDELPMFRICYEELKNSDDTDVTFIRVWIFVFDPTHSTSELLGQVLSINSSLLRSQSASGQDPHQRNKGMTSESERRKKTGFSYQDLQKNFESTVGMQFVRMHGMETYCTMLRLHAGPSVNSKGRMFVPDFSSHMDRPMGRRKLKGDPKNGHGGLHPVSPEFVFNAKREGSLRYGAINLDGSVADIHEKYLRTSSYWNGDVFKLPANSDMWMCTSVEKRTIMELPLPRPLQNQVVPGPHFMHLFNEHMDAKEKREREKLAAQNAGLNMPNQEETAMDVAANMNHGSEYSESVVGEQEGEEQQEQQQQQQEQQQQQQQDKGMRPITSNDYAKVRSLATGRDETQRQLQEDLRSQIHRFDIMTDSAIMNTLSSSDSVVLRGDNEGSFRIKTEKITDRIASESSKVFNDIINEWLVKTQRSIEDRRSKLEEDGVDPDGEEFEALLEEEDRMRVRLFNVKKDLAQYHLRCILQCFHSAHDRTTLPAGYKAMVSELESLINQNGGVASMAFPPNRTGKQITASDRQVWHELQEWLGVIFSKDALISGRDRFLMISDAPTQTPFQTPSLKRFNN